MKFIMQRDRIVVSKFGRAIEFLKGVPTHVPEMCWDECQAQGAVPEDDLPVTEAPVSNEPQGAERARIIADSIKTLVLRGQRDDFTASGSPSPGALSQVAGFPIDAKERDISWALAQTEDR